MNLPSHGSFLDRQIDAYEHALRESPDTDIAQFLPYAGHPEYYAVLTELLRVRLELGWRSGQPLYLGEAIDRFPELLTQKIQLEALAFEEYRQRRLNGEPVEASEYEIQYALPSLQWPRINPIASTK
jgi:hypothetical protein